GAAGGGFLQGDWVSPGTFVAAVDLGFGWRRESLSAFDRTFTDDHEQSTTRPGGTLNFDGPFTGEIADLVSGRMPGRLAETERNALIFSGTGLADVAVAAALYEAALAKGLGTVLPL
ncbi:MAG: ornithine cyclodeaminase family protein, partial [Alphaproteobacteria bacterium]